MINFYKDNEHYIQLEAVTRTYAKKQITQECANL